MKYFNKRNIMISMTLIIMVVTSLVLCNISYSLYKTRIEVSKVNLNIKAYQEVNSNIENNNLQENAEGNNNS